jgi:hypothetical protein
LAEAFKGKKKKPKTNYISAKTILPYSPLFSSSTPALLSPSPPHFILEDCCGSLFLVISGLFFSQFLFPFLKLCPCEAIHTNCNVRKSFDFCLLDMFRDLTSFLFLCEQGCAALHFLMP